MMLREKEKGVEMVGHGCMACRYGVRGDDKHER